MANAERRAHVVWEGDLPRGNGRVTTDSTKVLEEAPVTWASRVERPDGKTSPEELIAAAHASCYSMAFSNVLAQKDAPPVRLEVEEVGGRRVIHNYGHGGAGVTLSWGCAEEVTAWVARASGGAGHVGPVGNPSRSGRTNGT